MAPRKTGQKGFTLIEMITVIVLLGIIAGILTPFIAKAMQAYTHSKARAELVAKGRLALERLAREVHQAVPNSLSVLSGGSGIEFARSRAGGRYVERFDNFGTEFSRINLRFRKNANLTNLYIVGTGLNYVAGDVLVIANTSSADLQAGNTATPISGIAATTATGPGNDGTNNGQILSFTGQQFTAESPGKHFSIADQTIEVGLSGSSLRWFTAAGLTNYDGTVDWSSSDPLLIDSVSAVTFVYAPGTPQSTGVLRVDLQIADTTTSETIRLYREIHVRNTP
ncbi:MAG: type II secretion system GspH family protein [Gammaproteobacteria bacterium]|nr:type II secretion system GspH family protein [Gammaproteobacteria bacterium]